MLLCVVLVLVIVCVCCSRPVPCYCYCACTFLLFAANVRVIAPVRCSLLLVVSIVRVRVIVLWCCYCSLFV